MKTDVYPKNLVSRALRVYRKQGLVVVGEKTAAKLKNFFFRSNEAIWFARELVHSRLHAPATHSGAETHGSFSCIAPQELARWLRERNDLTWAADTRELEIASSLKHPWTCWRLGGEIVAFCKIGGGQVFIVDFERALVLPEKLAFLSDVYVLPSARRKGIGRQLLLATMSFLKELSFSVLSCHIPARNQASVKLFSSLGFRPFGKIRFVRIVGVSTFSTKPELMLVEMTAPETTAFASHGPRGS